VYELASTLCEMLGPDGEEGLLRNDLVERWEPRVDHLEFDGVGNLIARADGNGTRLMIAAHADEINFVVRCVSDDGFIWIASGGRDMEQRPSLRGQRFLPWGHPALVLTEAGPVVGLSATLTGHALTPRQRAGTQMDWNDILVDVRALNRSEAEAQGVQVGDRVICNPPTSRCGSLVCSKAMDDRVGLAIMGRLLGVIDRDRSAYDLTFVSTVQEELGLVGADSAAAQSGCEMAIALDVGLAGDVPGVDPRDVSAGLGAGPGTVHKDLVAYSRPPRTLALIETAKTAGIPVQPAVYSLYGSDAGAFTRLTVFGQRWSSYPRGIHTALLRRFTWMTQNLPCNS